MDNPFHRIGTGKERSGKVEHFLVSSSYSESDLPALPEHVPSVISKLVLEMLSRNPSEVSEVTSLSQDLFSSLMQYLFCQQHFYIYFCHCWL